MKTINFSGRTLKIKQKYRVNFRQVLINSRLLKNCPLYIGYSGYTAHLVLNKPYYCWVAASNIRKQNTPNYENARLK